MTKKRKRPMWPMPIEAIVRHPEFLTLTDVGAGMIFKLASHYWLTACAPLPEADYDLRNICRSHPQSWRRLKPAVTRIFNAARPELDAYWRARTNKTTTLSLAAQKGQSKRRLSVLLDQAAPLEPVLSIPNKSDRPSVHPTPRQAPRRIMTDRR